MKGGAAYLMVMHLQLPRLVYDAIIAHTRAEMPNECVGMLLGHDGLAIEYIPLINELQSPTRFLTEARSMLAAEKRRRHLGCEVLAMVHSHPTSEPVPSKYDIADHYGSEVMCVIVSLQDAEPSMKAWSIVDQVVSEGTIILSE
jgi:[CysO sulfur-carrier protein]-S-L-cysteine hydrolase